MLNKVKTKCVVFSLCVVMMLCRFAHAEIKIDSVYPTIGKMGEDLKVTISGSGFDNNTSVYMAFDSGNRAKIIGHVDTPANALSVTVVGSTAYIADGDSGLQVIDISEPANPKIMGHVDTQGFAESVIVAGGFAYIADGSSGLQVIDISNPSMPKIIGHVDTPGDANSVTVVGGFAYIADGSSGLQVIDISWPANPKIIGHVDTPANALSVTVAGSFAYIANYSGSGLQVIDISWPANPKIIGSISGYANSVTVVGSFAYIATDSGLEVIDISSPANPKFIGSIDTPDWANSVTVVGGFAYIAGRKSGLQVIDISNPAMPKIIGQIDTPGHANSVTVVDSIAYIADASSGLQVIDISNPANSAIIGHVDTPEWAHGVTVVGSLAYIADGYSGLQVIDISNPANPEIIGSVDTPGGAKSVTVVGSLAYIADGYDGSLQVIDVSDSANPKIIGSVDTPGSVNGVTVAGGFAYIVDYDSGLQVIDVSDSANPKIIGSVDTPGSVNGVTVVGSLAYIADGYSGLQVIDISNPANPEIIGSVDTPGGAESVTVAGSFAYIAGGYSGFQVIDISDPTNPIIIGSIIGSIRTLWNAISVTVVGSFAYIVDYDSGLQVIDISNPVKPKIIGSIYTPRCDYYCGVTIVDNKAYIADGCSGLVIVPIPVEVTPSINLINSNTLSVTLPSPQLAGQYNIRLFNNSGESSELKGAVSFFEPTEYWQLAQKKAIIVAGRSAADNVLWNSTKTCTNMAYRALLTQGYTRNTIQYLSPENLDADHDGALNDVDEDAALSTLEYAITNWAADTNELLLYMTDHGGDGTFRINPTEIVTAQELDRWLDAFQNRTHARVILVYDACLSGSFLQYLQPPNDEERIIITSAKSNESSYFNGPGGAISFSYQFWASVMMNGNLNAAFTAGDKIVTGHTPQLDGNGDGVTNQALDYSAADNITICRGRSVKREPPRIGDVCPDQTLDGNTSATIWVDKVNFTNAVDRLFAIIEPPGLDALPSDIPVTDLPSVELAAVKDANGTLTGKYEAVYNGFNLKGTYKIAVYAVDKEEIYSNPAKTKVVQNQGETNLFVLASPKGGIYNSTQNVQLVGSPVDAAIYYTVDGNNPTSAANKYIETAPISISKDTVLKFMAIDSSGKQTQVYTENYTIDTVAPLSPNINLPENENSKIITNPYPTFYWKAPKDADYCTLQYSNSSDFSNYEEVSYLRGASGESSLFYTVSIPLECGNWYWRIKSVDKAGNQSSWSSFEFSFEEDTAIHKAIIVSTGDTDEDFQTTLKTITSQAYTALTWQNYEKSNIYLLSSDSDFDADKDGQSDVSADIAKGSFESAVKDWASDADDLIIFMVGQGEKESLGEKGSFRLNSTETVTGTELDLWIDTLQSTADVKVRIVYDATASGSFIPLLLPPEGKERITITSTPVIESKITPVIANFPDNGGLSFSYQFWFNIRNTAKLYDSYRIGHEMMTGHKQYATYDANGNGITYDDDDGEDGDFGIISKIKIGYGRIAASSPPVIGSVCSSQIVTQTQVSTKSFSIKNIWVSNIASLNPIAEVMAIVSKPVNNQDIVAGQTSTPFDEILLQDIDGDKKYEGSYSDQVTHSLFDSEGTYTIAIYAKDSQGYYSLPVTTTVTVVKDGDNSNYAILTEKSPAITIAEGVHVKVIGSAGANIVNVGSGAKVECINFPGQNQINIEENSSNFTIKRSGAMVYLQSTTTGTMVKIPATLTNQTIKFTTDDRSFTLVISNGVSGAKVMFGSLEIGLTEVKNDFKSI